MPVFATALVGLFLFSGAFGAQTPVALEKEEPPQVVLPSYTVKVTGYNAVSWQTDGDPSTTASGAFSNPEVVAARSRDLAAELPFGTVIEMDRPNVDSVNCGFDAVSGLIGYRVIADTMNERMHNTIDLLFENDVTVPISGVHVNPSRALGVCDEVVLRVIGRIDPNHIPKTQEALAKLVTNQPAALAFADKGK